MDIQEKQAKWNQERPLFEADFIHSHLLPFFNFNENTGDYEIKSEYENDEDRVLSFNVLNTGWVMWLRAKRAQADAVNQPDQMTISFDRFEELINKAVNAVSKTVAVPEGFVLISKDTKTVVAIEQMVEQQVEASGMDSNRLERLDGWRIIDAAIEAQEQGHD